MKRRELLRNGLAAGIAALTLGGCGFHLRGNEQNHRLPALTLTGDTTSPFAREFRASVEFSDVELRADAPWVVTLGTPRLLERRLGADDRASNEHELSLEVEIALQARDTGAYHLHPSLLRETTRLRLSDDDLLNRETLISDAVDELSQRLARRALERLANIESWR
ncbi:hypothetical protein R5M92_05840 [Halomonas sp. Bachu 37]|uniref:LPS-assembly lipoprotein LptE n=1 Tax=Halomonas kashgarensis TaxID=3084920 RepID=UPI003217497A